MNETIISTHARRTTRNLLIANVLLVLAVLAIAAVSNRYLYNVFAGPFAISEEEIFAIDNPDAVRQYYVTIEADEAEDTGFQEVTQRVSKSSGKVQSESVSAIYLAAFFDDRFVLVKAPPGASGTRFTGALSRMVDYEQEFVDELEQDQPGFKESGTMPMFVLDAERNFRVPGYLMTLALLVGLGLGLWNIVKALRRISEPGQHPALEQLRRYGPPQEVAMAISADLGGAPPVKLGRVTLGNRWLTYESMFGVQTVPLGALVWIYHKVQKIHMAVLVMEQGKPLEIPLKQQEAQALLTEIARRVPWVIAGYSPEIEKIWRSSPGQLVQAVAERRGLAMGQASSQAPSQGQGAWAG
jgi:hypothetical protein